VVPGRQRGTSSPSDQARGRSDVVSRHCDLHGAMRRRSARSCRVTVVSPAWNDRQPGQEETACGVVSLRRYCPDQVPGGRRAASELSPASQPSLPAPGHPGARSVQLPRSPRRRCSRCMAPMTDAQGRKPRPAQAKRRVSPEARGLAGRRRSCFQVWPQGHSLAVAASGPSREPIDLGCDEDGCRILSQSTTGQGTFKHRTPLEPVDQRNPAELGNGRCRPQTLT
jgi:hypothetical protein